jgi:hypothetical protein
MVGNLREVEAQMSSGPSARVKRKSQLLFGDVNDLFVGVRFVTSSKESILGPIGNSSV